MASARGWWKVVLGAAIAALVGAWFRHREPELVDEASPGTAQWPPLTPLAGDEDPPERAPAAQVSAVLAPVDPAPPAPDDPASVARTWMAPDDEGNCPLSYPVKVKESSGIHHVPGGFSYDRTRADRCYATGANAEADGYRAAKR